MLAILAAFCYEYRLRPAYTAVVAAAGILLTPVLIRNAVKRKREQLRFVDASGYMNQMLSAFKRRPLIPEALSETLQLFPEGAMHGTLLRALSVCRKGEGAERNRAALMEIEKSYENDRIRRMHDYFYKTESLGGSYQAGIEAQLADIAKWAEGIGEHQQSIRKYKTKVTLAVLTTAGVCGVPALLLSDNAGMDISAEPLYQAATVLFMVMELLIYLWADKKLNISWLSEEGRKRYDMEEQYLRAVSYDAKKEQLRSAAYASVPALLCVFFLFRHSYYAMAAAAAAAIFLLCQHSIGHKLNVKLVRREIEKQFPAWLMEIVLRLQMENVQVSILKSEESAPAVLRPAVRKLVQELSAQPESAAPYLSFLKEFSIPEVSEAMKRFYTISEQGGGDMEAQIMDIIERSNSMVRKAERLRHEDAEGNLFGLILAPELPVVFECIVSLYVLMLQFFAAFSANL